MQDLNSLVDLAASVSFWERSSRSYSFNGSAYQETAYTGLSGAGLLRVSVARSAPFIPKPPAEGLKAEPPYIHERYAIELLEPRISRNVHGTSYHVANYLFTAEGKEKCYFPTSKIKSLYERVESPRFRAAGAGKA